MSGSVDRKFVLVKRRTRLDDLIARFNSAAQARFYVEHLGADFSDYENEHRDYGAAIACASRSIAELGRLQVLDRAYLPNYLFAEDDIVVAIGQDGLVANTLKYLRGQPLVGVNPSPGRWDGVLLPFQVGDLTAILPEVAARRRPLEEVAMAQATLGDGQSLLAVNDIFIGQKTHVSARYHIEFDGKSEAHSSSGIIISTGLGSTGWLKSIACGAVGLAAGLSGVPAMAEADPAFRWNSDFLCFSVREPFPSRTTGNSIVFGRIHSGRDLHIRSMMSENGVIFSDGIESDFLEFNSGAEARIALAERRGILVR